MQYENFKSIERENFEDFGIQVLSYILQPYLSDFKESYFYQYFLLFLLQVKGQWKGNVKKKQKKNQFVSMLAFFPHPNFISFTPTITLYYIYL